MKVATQPRKRMSLKRTSSVLLRMYCRVSFSGNSQHFLGLFLSVLGMSHFSKLMIRLNKMVNSSDGTAAKLLTWSAVRIESIFI